MLDDCGCNGSIYPLCGDLSFEETLRVRLQFFSVSYLTKFWFPCAAWLSVLQPTLVSMLSPSAAPRPNAAAFASCQWFQEDMLLRALRFLDGILQRESSQKVRSVALGTLSRHGALRN